MMNKTEIEWCDSTWNPVTGCLKGCEYCYARKQAHRFAGHDESLGGVSWEQFCSRGKLYEITEPFSIRTKKGRKFKGPYPFDFEPTLHYDRLEEPIKAKRPRSIFVCSMADLFGDWVPDEWIEAVFAACEKAPQHRYLFLTKNPKKYTELAKKGKLPQSQNMWYGTTVTDTKATYFCVGFKYNTFISIEPLLEPLNVGLGSFSSTEWIIIGAETGNRKNKVIPQKEWIDNICEAASLTKASVFMKDSLVPIVGEENMRREFPWTAK